ncbi:EAL domain-containing protein [Acidovorax facilis]|uniref:EAL domain-containing protein n=1 Tax=Acidovorax facilis TaxID=12917 RepID=UPI003CF8DE07
MTTTPTALVDGFFSMAERSPDVIARFDEQGRKAYANPSYNRIFGTNKLDVPSLVQQAVVAATTFTTQVPWTDAEGLLRQLGIQLTPELGSSGAISGWWMVGRDVTGEYQLHHRLAQMEKELVRRDQEFQALTEHSLDAVVRYDRHIRCVYANGTFLRLWSLSLTKILGKRHAAFWKYGGADHMEGVLRHIIRSNQSRELEYTWTAENGQQKYMHLRLVPEHDAEGKVASILTIGRDITDRKESQSRLARAESMARIGHWQWDFAQRQSFVSEELCRLFGKPLDWRPTPEQSLECTPVDERERILNLYKNAYLLQQPELAYTYGIVTVQGESLDMYTHVQIDYGPEGPLRLRGTTRDITELKQYETRLTQITLQDPLTGLPNRTSLHDRLQAAIAKAVAERSIGGVLVLNLDRFKEVNNILGHGQGDHLLVLCGRRLQQFMRSSDTVARLGADEFAVLLPQIRDAADLVAIAKKINAAISQPIQMGDQPLVVTCSIGIAQFPIDAVRANELLQHADSALTEAKTKGRSGYHLYSAELTDRARERAQLGIALRRAEPNEQLEVYYQPKVALDQGTWVGAEALLRWNHPQRGLVTPDRFIGLAEENGLIVGIGTWVLTKACLAAREWNRKGQEPFRVAVNLSPVQFQQDDLVATVRSVLLTTGCESRWLELEITENLLLDANEGVRSALYALREMGITVAIDDFGTGYSSLAYLKRFPIDVLKIDRTFIHDIGVEHSSTELTKAIVSIGSSLDMQLVAEGVETEAQAKFLLAQGCQLAQGYLYGKPMPKNLFESIWQQSETTTQI